MCYNSALKRANGRSKSYTTQLKTENQTYFSLQCIYARKDRNVVLLGEFRTNE